MVIVRGRSNKLVVVLIVLMVLIIILIASIGIYWYVSNTRNPIPEDVRQNLTFSPLTVPAGAKSYSTSDYKFDKAEENVYVLSYIIHPNEGNTITVSQYPQPQQFEEIPEYKERFLTNVAKQYDTVQTANGTIYLGRLTKQNNKQLGIMLENGLIVFLSPDKEMDKTKWRNLGDQLEVQKIVN